MPPHSADPLPATVRWLADRRRGVDRRAARRRDALQLVSQERRRQTDRRLGAERRSTLDRRVHSRRPRSVESPGEHLRNALQLLSHLNDTGELSADYRADLAAAWERLRRALHLLEGRNDQT